MKVKLLKKLRKEANESYKVVKEYDDCGETIYYVCYYYTLDGIPYITKLSSKISSLEEAKSLCNQRRRNHIYQKINEKYKFIY